MMTIVDDEGHVLLDVCRADGRHEQLDLSSLEYLDDPYRLAVRRGWISGQVCG